MTEWLDADRMPCGLCRLDGQGGILAANAGLAALLGRGAAELAGTDFAALLSPGARVYHQLVVWPGLLLQDRLNEVALTLLDAEGQPQHVLMNVQRHVGPGGAVVECALLRLRQKKAMEDRLIEAQRTAEQQPGALFRLLREPGGRFRLPYASPRFYAWVNADANQCFDDAASLFDAIHPADRPRMMQAIGRSADSLRTRPLAFRLATPDRRLCWVRVHCNVRRELDGTIVWQGTVLDVTQQRLIDERLREVDKLQAVATLAAGIAHDFNNVLGAITGLAELCEAEVPAQGSAGRNLRRILEAAARAATLVQQLVAFSSRQPQQVELLWAGELLQRCQPLLAASLPPQIRLQLQVDQDAPLRADAAQLEQALHNLVDNAAYAMREAGGTVRICVDEAPAATGDGSTAARVRLRVIDQGEGMPAPLVERIFEPFFTTKPVDIGTGLGLSAVHGIVTGHGGHLSVQSQPGEGSVFTLLLPRADAPHSPEPEQKVEP